MLLIANKRTVYFVSTQNRNELNFEIANFKLYLDINVKIQRLLIKYQNNFYIEYD